MWFAETYENFVRLFMNESPMKIIQYTSVNIWWILDEIMPQNCRTTFPLHKLDAPVRSTRYKRRYYIFLHLGLS